MISLKDKFALSAESMKGEDDFLPLFHLPPGPLPPGPLPTGFKITLGKEFST